MEIETLNISKTLSVVFQRKAIILKIFVSTVFLTVLAAFFITPKYKVFTELLLDPEEKNVTSVSHKSFLLNMTSKINSEKAMIRSPVVLTALALKHPELEKKLFRDESIFRRKIKDFLFSSGGKKERPSDDTEIGERVRFLTETINVDHITQSNVLIISLNAGDPVYGVQVLNDLLENYLKHRGTVGKFPGASNFFDEQIGETKQRLKILEEELSNFQQKEKIIDYKSKLKIVTKRIETLYMGLTETKLNIISLKQDISEIKANLNHGGDPASIPSAKLFTQPFLSKIYKKRIEMQLNLINMKQNYRNEDPKVMAAIKEIQMVDDTLRREVNKIIALMESSLAKLKTKEKAIAFVIEDLNKLSLTLPKAGAVINKFKRDIENEKTTLTNLVQKRNQEMVSEARDKRVENIKLITPPTYPRKKVKPRRGLFILTGICVGLIMGFGLALIQGYFDQSFNNEEEISQYIGLPVLGTIHDFTKD